MLWWARGFQLALFCFNTLMRQGAFIAWSGCVVTKGFYRSAAQQLHHMVQTWLEGAWFWMCGIVRATKWIFSCCSVAVLSQNVRDVYPSYCKYQKRMRRKRWLGTSDGSLGDEYFIIAHDCGCVLVLCLGCYCIYKFLYGAVAMQEYCACTPLLNRR